jgi:dTDP-4-dehydrorhamnose 3,5-epimerase
MRQARVIAFPQSLRFIRMSVKMDVIQTSIQGVVIIEPKLFGDHRGFFLETFQAERYASHGIHGPFVQDSLSRSTRGVVRGLHLQNPSPQGKLVMVLRGCVLDVAVDVRVGSPTFGHHVAIEINDENHRQFWIPRGFAHGFAVLSESADFFYKCDDFYQPSDEIVVRWDDPAIGISWRIESPVLSTRDAAAPLLAKVEGLPIYGSL